MPLSSTFSRGRPLVHRVSLSYLIIVPVLLAIATVSVLFAHSDVNAAMLWSQCHSRALLPALSRVPALGTPACYLVSFFRAALSSLRSFAVMSVVLAFVAGLLTVSSVEAARVCNAPNVLIAYPAGPWLVFTLVGGAVVWELAIIPAFLHSAKRALAEKQRRRARNSLEDWSRHLPDTDVVAIPVSVALGFVLPSVLMLVLRSPATIGVWLFFPIYVSVLRTFVRKLVAVVKKTEPALIHLESNRCSLACVYALPILLSVMAHVFIIWNLTTRPDDRKKLTRSTLAFIEIDIQFVFWTVLYWMLVEVGWRVPLATFVSSFIMGPGAGTCLGWIYREKLIHDHEDEDDEESQPADEETPLLHG